MHRFILFVKRTSFVFLFIVIEIAAFRYYVNSSSYNQAKAADISNRLAGNVYAGLAEVRQYFSLASQNRMLTEEIAALRGELSRYEGVVEDMEIRKELPDSLEYAYMAAKIINNSINRAQNFMTLNKGARDGVTPNMGVISNGAIVGYVQSCSERFSSVVSVLNTDFRTSGKLLNKDNSAGTIFWDARSYEEMVMTEIPKYAEIAVGDTVITTEFSLRYPEGLLIGTVKEFELINGTYYNAKISLFARMGSLNNVVLIRNENADEKQNLEQGAN